MDKLHFERTDYSVVAKNRAPPPKAWRWEIYRAGNASQIKQSSVYFDTIAAARQAGGKAAKELMGKPFCRAARTHPDVTGARPRPGKVVVRPVRRAKGIQAAP